MFMFDIRTAIWAVVGVLIGLLVVLNVLLWFVPHTKLLSRVISIALSASLIFLIVVIAIYIDTTV